MYSKAKLAGHPIHPMLVAFPVALYATTIVTLIAYAVTADAFWFRAGMCANIAGVVMAAVAMIPGTIDLFALPARSRARATGYKHAGANLVAAAAFTISAALLWRSWHTLAPLDVAAPLALDAVGLFATGVAGVFGWTMVQRHHVGVRPTRFVTQGATQHWEEIDDLDEIPPQTIGNTDVNRAPITWH